MGDIAGIVLAAGASRRMGRNKLLLPFRGRPLVCAALDAVTGAGARPVICVLGQDSEPVRAALANERWRSPVCWAVNPDAASGRASSIRVGLASVPQACAAALFMPGDVPGVRAQDVEAVIARFRLTGASVVIATESDGNRSHPVLFARSLFPRLRRLRGDTGGQGIVRELWECAEKVARTPPPLFDVDTQDDYDRLREVGS